MTGNLHRHTATVKLNDLRKQQLLYSGLLFDGDHVMQPEDRLATNAESVGFGPPGCYV